ncbi:MAG: MFS transporter [Gammaproteobacteria bacterium]|nr:MFS transporter [Gammaproteobacteria bacterium]
MRIKSIVSCSIGNVLEWYDFGLFAIFSPLFSRLFFPEEDPEAALIMTFGVLAIGFLCRPIGALIFGYLGDKRGRVKTIRLSILMISIPTLLIGLIPTYASIHLWAPIILVLIRIWQGISLGGEYSGNLIYLTESAPTKWRATITSLAGTGANLGILLAALVSTACSSIFSDAFFQSAGWRIPYILSGLLSLGIYFGRLKMQETEAFSHLRATHQLAENPIKTVFKYNKREILRTIGMVCMGSIFYYLSFIYMPTFLMLSMHLSLTHASALMTCYIGSMIFLVPIAGYICDQVSRRKMLLFNVFFIITITVCGFHFLLGTFSYSVLWFLALITIASSLEQATTCVAVVENFPLPARYTGLSLGYNVGNAIFGGTAAFVCELLITKVHFLLAPAFYIVISAMVTGLVVFFFVPDTRGVNLNE